MTAPTATLVAPFSEPGAPALPWSEAERVLTAAEMFWLSTVRRDGRPHVAPLPAMWLHGCAYFCTGAEEQKAVNLAAEPRCVLTTGTNTYRAGVDVVLEGRAAPVTEMGVLRELTGLWRTKLDWVFEARDGKFVDPDHGNQAVVYALRPVKVLAFTKGPYSQTRYTF
ncbi:pyridoxamine 5'-phosphate oxidase family protein [Symbioplanes lichenis]|uniref:pyridoxamine 5'-phosphate oxidase family protein n=1 Tax=Symbioplanes lichenis TaxID=1629072 RepID=UPI002739416D|nr:pyridoxamine 5'-phosphate oxidase family protein [Actinoplanes lichenis]